MFVPVPEYRTNNTIFTVLEVTPGGMLLSLMVITGLVQGNVSASTENTATSSNVTSTLLTPDQLAAGGPLPGNLSLIESEQECVKSLQQNETTWAPWYPTMASTEHGSSERAAVFEFAHFGVQSSVRLHFSRFTGWGSILDRYKGCTNMI